LLTVAFLILLTIGPSACWNLNDCADVSPYFTVEGLTLSNFTFTGQQPKLWKLVEDNHPIKIDSFFMRVTFEKSFHSKLKSYGGQNLYATTCDENGSHGSQVGIDTIYLVTLQDYNSQYFKNDTLNNIVKTNYWMYFEKDFYKFFPLSSYIAQNKNVIVEDGLDIKIAAPPSNLSSGFNFKLIFILQGGDRFEATNKTVQFSN
jgi:hypothetical protein